ncbi:MAG: GatB/YqeY domain-containing protein [Ruminococcaceae bacterium]|nr:GatB/YqeY domain-containing protein [Oscillospiraceae bacterium]
MMLKEQLANDLKDAMKAKDEIKKNAVQMVRAGVLQVEKDKKITLDDEGIIEVIAKEVKKRKDVLPDFEKAGRADLIEATQREIEILTKYLPSQLTEEELDKIVSETVSEIGASSMKDMGKVMSALMPKVKGRADGKTVNELVKKHLG